MKYMSIIPDIASYEFPDGSYMRAKDIFKRPSIKLSSDVSILANTYNISDGDTPEKLSKQLYNDYHLFWTFYLTNDIIDIYKDWPISYSAWIEQVIKTNPEYVIYTRFKTDIKIGDIVCKYDINDEKFNGENYGIVSNYDPFNRKIEFLLVNGTLSKGDTITILRETSNGFQKIVMPDDFEYQTIIKIEEKISSFSYFIEKGSIDQGEISLSPYYTGTETIDSDISDLQDAPDTLLWKYMNDDLPYNTMAISLIQEKENEFIFKRNIIVIPKTKIPDLLKSVVNSIQNQKVFS